MEPIDPTGEWPLDVVVVGSANVDLVVRVDRRPGRGETVLGSDLSTHPGGKGANQAVAAARLGARVALLGRVGADGHGRLLRESLERDKVDLGHLREAGAPTGVALITVGPEGDNSIIVSPGANARLEEQDVADAAGLLRSAPVVSLQLETPLPTVLAAARAAHRAVFNLSPPAPVPDELLALCDPLVVNEHEARMVLGAGGPPAEQARALLRLGPRSVVITLGAGGAVAADASGVTTIPSPRVEAVDTTGAGDAFTGALAWRLARGDGLADAVAFAVRVGAATVRGAGAQSSFPTLSEVEEP
ncbi:ribokinase [Sphaerisporangium melleum]|uniref:Ribokinase n=1 Tax=Sphaerisporangium melleum TaxID=321316 RepID=A0A917QXQ8_9ACTN|nr:ribokinase [Sphaerisporangium melleum]GGK76647.1 ribokinase [Sphaerisporangium melleum]GII69592.1 ribokinase [Sphaerisporangium melleum]